MQGKPSTKMKKNKICSPPLTKNILFWKLQCANSTFCNFVTLPYSRGRNGMFYPRE